MVISIIPQNATPKPVNNVCDASKGLSNIELERTELASPAVSQVYGRNMLAEGPKALPAGTCKIKAKPTPELTHELKATRRLMQGIRLPAGHRYFPDRERETYARLIDWSMGQRGAESVFATYTFRDYVSQGRANTMLNRHLARMAESLKHTGGGRLKYAVATEWQKRDVIHFHLVLTAHGLGNLSRKRWEARWEHNGGGYARLYEADRAAAPYLAKYMNKRHNGDFRLGGAWLGNKPPGVLDPSSGPANNVTRDPGYREPAKSAHYRQAN